MYKRLVILSVFLLGLYFIHQSNNIETFTSDTTTDASGNKTNMTKNCPDVLIQKGSALFLYNSKRATIPGVNPIRFENLDEYIEFTEWQRSQNILCPILYLQHAYNAQGDPVYKARPSPTNLQGGLPDYYIDQPILPYLNNSNPNIMPPSASTPYQGVWPSQVFGNSVSSGGTSCSTIVPCNGAPNDCTKNYKAFNSQDQSNTPLDNLYSTSNVSPNPMDDNWGGIDYTEKLIQAGYYKGNEVSIATA